MIQNPRRLIEVDLPIKRISSHARREKSIRHGHISTLHIWWARRPLAACRAVICAALWLDPADHRCPTAFIKGVREEMLAWTSHERQKLLSEQSRKRFEKARKKASVFDDPLELRGALLDFIADFANWDNSTVSEYLDTSRALTQSAHEALGGTPGTRPLVVDPFAGGGSIPLEALRVGADVFASDLNPVAALLNKAILQSIPKYGRRLADEVRSRGQQIQRESQTELAEFYPRDADGRTPVVYLWARTIRCEGPGCGVEVPLIRSLWLSKKANRQAALQLVPNHHARRIDIRIIVKHRDGWVDQVNEEIRFENPKLNGTVRRSSVTCPFCGYTTSAENTRKQFLPRAGGANDARLIGIVLQDPASAGVSFRLGSSEDLRQFAAAVERCAAKEKSRGTDRSLVPDEPLPYLRSIFNIYLLGVDSWGKLFNGRQALALVTLVEKTRLAAGEVEESGDKEFSQAVALCLAFAVDRCADYWSSLAVWSGEFVAHTFGRQALGIIWDYAEVNGFAGASGTYSGAIEWICRVIESLKGETVSSATVECVTACQHPLPDDSAQALITDPPYYDAVPYADLADFFYVWLKRLVGDTYPNLFGEAGTPKEGEIVQLSERNPIYAKKTREHFEALMKEAMAEGRRVLEPKGIGIVVFAHKSTTGWETQIQAMIDAGWMVTASWPIDTERPGRLRANNSAALASSVHLVCRPRENPDGSVRMDEIGDWRDVLLELPRRIHDWMPRLVDEGIVGADAIFACLGPALEIFSRFSQVEKASGETVTLKEYLEQVWAAVAKEALALVFKDADVTGFEADARLTAMWLWTLSTATSNDNGTGDVEDEEDVDDEEDGSTSANRKIAGFVLEYDAARKIAQGLGAHLEQLTSLIEVKGSTARLLPVGERTRSLFHKGETGAPTARSKAKKKATQLSLGFVADLEEAEGSGGWGETGAPQKGETVLDRVHQSMILFGAGRGEALKRFLVDDGAGRDDRFWRLAQAFSALYPSSTDEKRWVDGVLARKKSLGF
jgi:putative DNA methylase